MTFEDEVFSKDSLPPSLLYETITELSFEKVAFSKISSLLNLLYAMTISEYEYIKKQKSRLLESQLATQFTL